MEEAVILSGPLLPVPFNRLYAWIDERRSYWLKTCGKSCQKSVTMSATSRSTVQSFCQIFGSFFHKHWAGLMGRDVS
jgi:hypothetical protein